MNGVRKKDQKTILDATFEESRKLVDESYVEEALKVSSNKQDRNRDRKSTRLNSSHWW